MPTFDPPGFLDDFNDAQREAWSNFISQRISDGVLGQPDMFDFDAPRPHFFNIETTPADADAVERDVEWSAFPRIVSLDAATDEERWQIADNSRDVQDEYCEWSVSRGGDGKIRRVTFTCEGPEYWRFLAATNPALALQLYQQHVNPAAVAGDLVGTDGRYNPRNKWNNSTSRGAMHLIQVNNTLGAEIELAAGASNTRAPNGAVLTDDQELIRCGGYGQAERHSDPTIGGAVNVLARQDAAVTLANPIGIYLSGLSTAGWQTPDGSDPASFWTVTRGTAKKAVRAFYEVPASLGFVVGDITINGRPISFGGQIADFITMKLTGLATRIGQTVVPPLDGCKRRKPGFGTAEMDVAAVIGGDTARR